MRTKEIYHKNTDLSNTSEPITVTKEHRPSYWAVLPAQVRYDPELPASAKILYAEISSLTDQRGYCYASNAYFMQLFGMAERTLQELLRKLRSRGYIRIQDGTGGSETRKIYAGINPLAGNQADYSENREQPAGDTPAEICGGSRKNLRGSPAEICTQNKKENRKENNPPKAPQGAPAWEPKRFEGFWNFYPVHKSKQAAIRAWDRLRPSDELIAEIGKALTRQKQSEEWTREDARIPYAATYLNQRRWEDEDLPPLQQPNRAQPFLPGEVRW